MALRQNSVLSVMPSQSLLPNVIDVVAGLLTAPEVWCDRML